jgi:hypothetical protein
VTRALHRRLDRLSGQISAGRLITLNVAHEHVDNADMVNATLTAAGIKREDGDLVVLLKSYGTLDAQPPCTLQSVLPLAPNGRKVLR